MPRSAARRAALGRLRTLASQACGFSLDQTDDDTLLFKVDSAVRRCGGLYRYVDEVAASATERQRFVETLCTHETRFFRHESHFQHLDREHFPALLAEMKSGARARRVRAWSVACSTGEEPTSIAITLCESFGADVECSVLGTDISRSALEKAQALRWPLEHSLHVPQPLLARYFLKGVGKEEGYVRPVQRVRGMLRFEQMNLVDPRQRSKHGYDVIFCRNVLIYFDAKVREDVSNALLEALAPGGLLVTGPSEGVSHVARSAEMVVPHIYRRKAKA